MKTPSTCLKLLEGLLIIFLCNTNLSYSQNHEWSLNCGTSNTVPCLATDHEGNAYLLSNINASASSPVTIGSVSFTHPVELLKFDNNGHVAWAKQFSIPVTTLDDGRHLIIDDVSSQRNIYIGGFTGSINSSATLTKFDENGNFLWQQMGSSQSTSYGKAIAMDHEGNVYLTGAFNGSGINFGTIHIAHNPGFNDYDYFLVKYDSTGNVLWGVNCGPEDGSLVYAGVAVDSHNSVYVALDSPDNEVIFGNDTLGKNNASNINVYLLKYDSSGNPMWGKNIGDLGHAFGTDIAVDQSDNVYLTGGYTPPINFPGLTSGDIMLIKYDINGNLLWAKDGSSDMGILSTSMCMDSYGNVLIGGDFTGTHFYFNGIPYANYDTTTTTAFRSGNVLDSYYAKFESDGTFIYAEAFGGMTDHGQKLLTSASDDFGNTFFAGYYDSPFIIMGNDTLHNPTSDRMLYITKVSSQLNSTNEIVENNSPVIFPNPAGDIIYINANGKDEVKNIQIYDVFGNLVFEKKSGNSFSDENINLQSLSSGVYFVNITGAKKQYLNKLIKL